MSPLPALLFTVEHGDNKVPAEYAHLFAGHESILASHRGYDPGAGELAVRFSTRFHAPCEQAAVTRLLIDQNRSLHNRRTLFSEFTRPLPDDERRRIIAAYYRPYREAVEERVVSAMAASGRVLHLAIHSFTPVLRGVVRQCDVGLMYDPSRKVERTFSLAWQDAIRRLDAGVRVRRNYPYRGVGDGVVPALRLRFSAREYIGLQIEVNQKYPLGKREDWKQLQKVVIESFASVFDSQ